MIKRKTYNWKCGDRTLKLGQKTLVMGILNVTPDSFSDGGNFTALESAVNHALEMIEQGADIIDIGGESTRPGSAPVSEIEEISRTVPVIQKIREQSNIPISIDTMKASVARKAIEAGADIINDVSAFETDPEMVHVAAQTGAGIVLMHMKGTPQTMQDNPQYQNPVLEIADYLKARCRFAIEHGVDRNSLCIDPGIGFGKTLEHNLELMRHIPELADTEYPILIGASRKSFIGTLTGRKNPVDRLAGSLGVAGWSAMLGAHILRVHDVIDTCDVCRIMDTLNSHDS